MEQKWHLSTQPNTSLHLSSRETRSRPGRIQLVSSIRQSSIVNRQSFVSAQIRHDFQGVVQPVSEIGDTNHERQLDDLLLRVVFLQFLKRSFTYPGGSPGNAIGVKNRSFFLVIKRGA